MYVLVGRRNRGRATQKVSVPLLQMEGIGKRFALVDALCEVSFSVQSGEVHALLGENGAGKSTLMKLLHGLHQPDQGRIFFDGKPAQIGSPQQSAALGIGMVHQHLALVGTLTAAENVMLSHLPFWIRKSALHAEYEKLQARFGISIEAQAVVSELPLPQKQQVELLRVLKAEPRLLILDEPTAVLAKEEAEKLLQSLRSHVRGGGAVIYISHKLEEVLAVADRVTVLRKGRVVVSGVALQGIAPTQLARWMMGQGESDADRVEHSVEKRASSVSAEVDIAAAQKTLSAALLDVCKLCVRSDRGIRVIDGLDLSLRQGEIYGIAGMGGSGQRELAEALAGVRPSDHGKVSLAGKEITGLSTEKRRRMGLALIPEDRLSDGVSPQLSVAENTALNAHHRPSGWLSMRAFFDFARKVLAKLGLAESVYSVPIWTLSGGNMQKVVVARELSSPGLRVLVAAYPSRGLDLGAVESIHRLLRDFVQQGGSVLLFSEELDELLSISDRLAVLAGGRLHGECRRAEADRTKLGLLFGGVVVPGKTGAESAKDLAP